MRRLVCDFVVSTLEEMFSRLDLLIGSRLKVLVNNISVISGLLPDRGRDNRRIDGLEGRNPHHDLFQVKQIASCQQAKYNRTISESRSRERGTLSPTFSRRGPIMTLVKILKPLFLITSNKKTCVRKIHEPADSHSLIRAMSKLVILIF